jgi:hypothetical protein
LQIDGYGQHQAKIQPYGIFKSGQIGSGVKLRWMGGRSNTSIAASDNREI